MTPFKNTQLFIEECKKRNIPYTLYTPSVLEVHAKEGFFIADTCTPLQTGALRNICKIKYITKQILDHHRIPNAPWKVIWRDHIEYPSHLSGPLICKHVDKQKAIGLERNIQNLQDLQKYFAKYPEERRILAEETLIGKEYRILLLGRKVFSVLEIRWNNGERCITEVYPEITPEVSQFFENIADIFKADILGIDVIMEDISKIPDTKNHTGILELNSAPGLYGHAHPDGGTGRNPAERIFDLLLKKY